MMLVPVVLALIAASESASAASLAAEADGDAAESQWTVPVAAPPSPAAPSGTPEGGYADPDRRRIDEERRKNVLDQLCRKLKLKKDFNVDAAGLNGTLGFTRRMEADVDGGLALIDEEELRIGWAKSMGHALGEGGPAGSVWAGATVEGRSLVVRRLGTFNTCSEVDRLIDVTDIKMALPFTAKRIMAMDRGELWRIPLTLNVGYGASLSDAMDGNTVSLSFGMAKSKNGAASMTLWRLNEKQARFRFRIDYVDVRSRSFNISKTIPVAEFVLGGTNAAMNFVNKEIAKQLNHYTSFNLGLSHAKTNGRRLILEYVIDPTDPEQAQAMADALQGNFRTLITLARRMATTLTSEDETRQAYEDLQDENSLRLGAATYAAMSEYKGRTDSFSLNIPFILNRNVTESMGSDKIVRYTGEGGEFQFHNAARTPNAEYFNVPFVGPIVKDLEHRNVDFVTYAPSGKPHEEPFGVYIHNQAFLRLPASSVTQGMEDANSVLRLAGAARRGAPDRTMDIPLPSLPPIPEGRKEQSDQKGWVSLTMVINQKAVREALAASSAEILKAWAFGTPVQDRSWAEWLVKNGKLEGGRLVYDQGKASRDLGIEIGGQSWLAKMSQEAGGLVGDLAEAAAAPSNEERAAKLAKAFSQESRSGLPHKEVFRVLIQFVDPMDITGDFIAAVEGTHKNALEIKARYVLKQGRAEVPHLGEAGETRGRFSNGSVLSD
jgi:pyruvate/2-oxoglutarate dehydrogenase complex dihydrolipoamide acyltransferase (E2) component